MITKNYDDEVSIVEESVGDYNLPGYALIEEYSRYINKDSLIELLDNRTYPNFIVLDSEYKILYIDDDSDISFEEYVRILD